MLVMHVIFYSKESENRSNVLIAENIASARQMKTKRERSSTDDLKTNSLQGMMQMHCSDFEKTIYEIVVALKERGYNSYEQLQGYISLDDDSYITRLNGAREKIHTLDMEQIIKYLKEQGW